MKQKVVIKVSLHGDKSRKEAKEIFIEVMKIVVPCEFLWKKPSAAKNRIRAMEVVAGIPGISSIALDGEEKNQVVVLGEDFDPVKLTKLLRRKVGYADVLSVDSSYTEKKESKKEETSEKKTPPKKEEPPAEFAPFPVYVPSVQLLEVPDNPGCNCRIM